MNEWMDRLADGNIQISANLGYPVLWSLHRQLPQAKDLEWS